MRIVVLGAVQSTLHVLEGLLRNRANVVGVAGLDAKVGAAVSGYAVRELESVCLKRAIPFFTFEDVNSPETVQLLRQLAPDLLFAVGFSQLMGSAVLSLPRRATIGFHPTRLPKGRGRAPLAWLAHDGEGGAATFFVMGAGMDDGPILAQEAFEVEDGDHAEDVAHRVLAAIDRALDRWVPGLLRGEWNPVAQSDGEATYTGIRRPVDGLISWADPVLATFARIRAASRPHPGAYTFAQDRKLIIWRAKLCRDGNWRGVPGRVLCIHADRGCLVQAGEGQLWLTDMEYADAVGQPIPDLKVGQRLGYVVEHEVAHLKQEICELRKTMASLASGFPPS